MDIDDIAGLIIDALNDRKGFEHWWIDLDEDNQAEIRNKIADIIEENV